MNNLPTRAAWSLWRRACRKDAACFEAAIRQPDRAQEAHLRSILGHAHGSKWAEQHSIGNATSIEEFRQRVPVMERASLDAWTDLIRQGERHSLSSLEVERLVPTSGTTAPAKLIPMTRESRREYSRAVNLWIHDALKTSPGIRQGRAYIATSPAQDFDGGQSSVAVGFADDREYLGPIEKLLLGQLLAVPLRVAGLRRERWREATRQHLLGARDLRFLSLWHPSYLDALFDPDELAQLHRLWPKLQLISCWADGACAHPAQRLLKHFPQASHQAKGLWLTEGAVSVPWDGHHPIALLSGFFEFEADNGDILHVHEIEKGETYRPILTNHAGLYRYRLGDLVEVDGFTQSTPSLKWVGRADQVIDLCGEKLSEAQVLDALRQSAWTGSMVLSPSEGTDAGYTCHVANGSAPFPLAAFEEALRRNPHYRWARDVGQLAPLLLKEVTAQQIDQRASTGSNHRKSGHLRDLRNG